MDEWGWQQLRPWLNTRPELPVGPLFCIIDGVTRGRPWSGAAVRAEFRRLAARAGVRCRFAPHATFLSGNAAVGGGRREVRSRG
jgi:hypothetical protein